MKAAMVVVSVLLVLLVGCSARDTRSYTDLKVAKADSRVGSMVFYYPGVCPSNATAKISEAELNNNAKILALSGVAASLAAFGVDFLVSSIEKGIEQYKEQLNGSFSANGIVKGKLAGQGCIVISRGLLGEDRKGPALDQPPYHEIFKKILLEKGLADAPSFYLELQSDVQGETLTLSPNLLVYADSIAIKKGSGFKNLSVGLAFTNGSIAATPTTNLADIKSSAYYTIDFGRVEVGKFYAGRTLEGMQLAHEVDLAKVKALTVVVADTEQPGLAYDAMKSAFTSNKDNLGKSVKDWIENALKKDE